MAEREFDVIVLGAGPAGEVVAGRLADGGLEVVVVEQHLIGGECSFYACMPSKALLRPGELLTEVRRTPGVAETVTGELDVHAVLERRDEVIHSLDDSGQLPWLEDKGIALVRGRGRLDGERRVAIEGGDVLSARRAVVVATGSSALLPPIDGLREAQPWTNREATTTHEPPARLAILGGGVVGVELAQAWATLGSQVTLVEAADRLIAREEPFASQHVADALSERGVDVQAGVTAIGVRAADGEVIVELDHGGPLHADQLLVAIGRQPNTEQLGLEQFGLESGETIPVDDSMRVVLGAEDGQGAEHGAPGAEAGHDGAEDRQGADAEGGAGAEADDNAPAEHSAGAAEDGEAEGGAARGERASDWLYAIGDVNGRVLLTHMGKYQAHVAADTILGKDARATHDGPTSPRVIFTDPQVAAVGHTLASAREAGLDVRAVDAPTQANAGASFYGRSGSVGTVRLVVDERRRVIVGATFTGFEVAEFLHAATIAIVGEVPLERLVHAVPSFPTRSEVWLKLLEQLGL